MHVIRSFLMVFSVQIVHSDFITKYISNVTLYTMLLANEVLSIYAYKIVRRNLKEAAES